MKKVSLATILLMCAAAFVLSNCGKAGDKMKSKEGNGKTVGGKTDAWNATNNPTRFNISFKYKYDELKTYTTGQAAQTPWPSDYWAYYLDSTNVRYQGTSKLSPMEKYDQAFNGWTPNMSNTPLDVYVDCDNGVIKDKHDDYYKNLGKAAKWQHENKGLYAARNGIDDDGDGKTDECGEDYDGIESWWGLCHAWVPAAILEPEGQKTVTMNGVDFTVSDIKALLISMYDRSSALMLGGRCNLKEVTHDEFGRIKESECLDTNAGAFYVVTVNMLGIQKRAFAEDRTMAYQVWNQPVYKYEIVSEKEVTEAEALQKLGHNSGKYKDFYNSPECVAWRYVKMIVYYVSESNAEDDGPLNSRINSYTRSDTYEMILELKSTGDVVGGEWVGYSMDTHPDFLWLPIQASGGNPYVSLAKVKQILEASRQTDQPTPSGNIKTYGGTEWNASIPDNKSSGVSKSLTVNDDIKITGLKVTVNITHTYIGDLKVTLTKGSKTVTLHDRVGGGTDNLNQTYSINDFNNTSAKGTWTIKVADLASEDTGKLVKMTLEITTGGTAPASNFKTFSNTTPSDIPDNDATGIESVIKVSDTGSIKSLKVTVDISHTYIGDLMITLVHNNSEQVLHSREGGGTENIQKTFTVPTFNGAPLNGDWKLKINDNAGWDTGTLNKWTIEAEL